ncbi:MAG: 3-keto-5-aminohexanoate cleavage protein [Pseudomonadales bacterium]
MFASAAQRERKAILMVAPNGARRTKDDHSALPVTARELAEETALAVDAGVTVVHAHARDEQGAHSLDIERNREVYTALSERLGDKVVIQLTTEAVGIYQPDAQMALIEALKPEAASFALRELIPDDEPATLAQGREFFHASRAWGTIAQYILYSAEDVARYHALKDQGVLPNDAHHLLFVLGRYTVGQVSSPRDLLPFVQAHSDDTPWAVCAFGRDEHRCASTALALGGDVRVGFENNLLDMYGNPAVNNATLVAQAATTARSMGREIMTPAQYRALFAL